jgi:hypothetical protein
MDTLMLIAGMLNSLFAPAGMFHHQFHLKGRTGRPAFNLEGSVEMSDRKKTVFTN